MSLMVEPIGRQVYVLSSLRVRINLDLSYKIDGKEEISVKDKHLC